MSGGYRYFCIDFCNFDIPHLNWESFPFNKHALNEGIRIDDNNSGPSRDRRRHAHPRGYLDYSSQDIVKAKLEVAKTTASIRAA